MNKFIYLKYSFCISEFVTMMTAKWSYNFTVYKTLYTFICFECSDRIENKKNECGIWLNFFLYYLFTLRHFCNPWHIFIKFLFNVILYLIILYKLTDYIYLIVGMKVAFVKSNEKAIKIGYAVLELYNF